MNKKYWRLFSWTFEAAAGKFSGTVEGVDLRDAVARIMRAEVEGGKPFGEVHGVSADILHEAPGNDDRHLLIVRDGLKLEVKEVPSMYVVKEGQMLYLRQARFRAQLEAGREHPHDVCAIARSVEEMHSMIDKHWPDADFSAVEALQP